MAVLTLHLFPLFLFSLKPFSISKHQLTTLITIQHTLHDRVPVNLRRPFGPTHHEAGLAPDGHRH
eukprot:6084635-Lingulodinium_polyedra.AAC.1